MFFPLIYMLISAKSDLKTVPLTPSILLPLNHRGHQYAEPAELITVAPFLSFRAPCVGPVIFFPAVAVMQLPEGVKPVSVYG